MAEWQDHHMLGSEAAFKWLKNRTLQSSIIYVFI